MRVRIHRYSECAYCIYVYTCTLYTPVVVPEISYSTENVVVNEGDGVAQVCLMLDVPLTVDLDVDVTSRPASG